MMTGLLELFYWLCVIEGENYGSSDISSDAAVVKRIQTKSEIMIQNEDNAIM